MGLWPALTHCFDFGAQRGNEAGEGGIGGCHFEAHELTDSGDVVDAVADDGGSVGVDELCRCVVGCYAVA